MDNLTHSLIGAAVANAGLKQKWGRGVLLTLILASNLPDVDVFWSLLRGANGFMERRMLTHSIVGVPLLSVLAAALLRKFYPHLSWKKMIGLCLLGAGLHVFFDLLNSYGVVALYPLSRARFEFSCVFIIDLFMLAILLAPLILSRIKTRWTPLARLSQISLATLTGYLLFCFWARAATMKELKTIAAAEHLQPTFSYAFPEALGPHRFRGVLKLSDEYRLYLVNVLKKSADPDRIAARAYYPTDENLPAVQEIRRRPDVQKLEWFFKAPVWQKTRHADGTPVYEVFDLRFVSFVLPHRRPFAFQFTPSDRSLSSDGK